MDSNFAGTPQYGMEWKGMDGLSALTSAFWYCWTSQLSHYEISIDDIKPLSRTPWWFNIAVDNRKINPICSMYGKYTNICPKNHPNVGKYTIHRAYGIGKSMNITIKPIGKASNSKGQAARPTGGDTWSSQQTVVTGKQPWPAGKSTI